MTTPQAKTTQGNPLDLLAGVARNPVLRREMDERAASGRAAAAVTLWLLLLCGLASLVYWGYSVDGGADAVTSDSARIGSEIFEWTLFGMMGLVLFLVPAFTASSVAGERTRQTLIPVQMTALGPFSIVLGKSLAAIAFTVLLIVAAAPILALAFFIGGVGVTDVVAGLAVIVLTAVVLGCIGIMFSALFSRVQAATVMTYGLVLAISIGTFVLLGVVGLIQALTGDPFGPGDAPPKELLFVNPFVALADATDSGVAFGANPLSGLRGLIRELERDQLFGNDPGETTALWRWYVVGSVLTVYSALFLATNRLRTPAETER